MRSSFSDNMGPTVKDSPPSSPGSESMSSATSGRRKRRTNESSSSTSTSQSFSHSTQYTPMEPKYQPKEEKESKLFDNGVNAPHMLGNQLNPNSSMAQKMTDTLNQEMKAHSIFTEAGNSSMNNLVGPPLHSRVIASAKASQNATVAQFSTNFSANNAASTSTNSGVLGSGTIPQTLDQLLERQWEQGSQFLMDQAQHFDIASLLSCLHQLRAENLRLEENVNSLLQRRDHLLAVNARLAIPLTSPSNNSGHANVVENGMPPSSSAEVANHPQFAHRPSSVNPPQQSTTIRHASGASNYQSQSSNLIAQNNSNNSNLIRNASVDMMRNIQR
ncbi:protein AF-10 [Phymastichus coffea]|uniref:protein AF-10 n=1 Tax=Phymastichus coffea TaxID=108790 RepID=UPI00273AD27A|nr:protein AF-10 [Phymastichus coffea]